MRTVRVGHLRVADTSRRDLARLIARTRKRDGALLVAAAHVSALAQDPVTVRAYEKMDVTYADGASVVALARLAGAKRIQRSPTTDLGVDLLHLLSRDLERLVTVAMIGGPMGLAQRAAAALPQDACRVVAIRDGYNINVEELAASLNELSPDVVFLGLGSPYEQVFAGEELGPRLVISTVVMTCGGWFGFLAGDEKRAPSWMQRVGLEWGFRVVQSPARLLPRYLSGAVATIRIAVRTGCVRMRRVTKG